MPLAAFAATAFGSCLGTRALIPLLRRRAVLDRPNERSLHRVPIPRGGGIALIGALLLIWAALDWYGLAPPGVPLIPLGASLLAIVSFVDDLHDLSPAWRLLAQAAAVTLGLAALPTPSPFEAWLDPWLVTLAAGVVWLWFVNLYNFMDGIDGLTGGETAAIGLGLLLFAATGVGADRALAALAAAIIGAAVGFLVWNRAPARIFIGDVGSVPLGYVLGFVLLDLAARGWWKIALILPLYYLADATITLLRRLLRGERVWRAHREHFYQRAVQGGLGHGAVVRRIMTADLLLVGCGWWAENGGGVVALGIAAAVVALLLAMMARPGALSTGSRTPGPAARPRDEPRKDQA